MSNVKDLWDDIKKESEAYAVFAGTVKAIMMLHLTDQEAIEAIQVAIKVLDNKTGGENV